MSVWKMKNWRQTVITNKKLDKCFSGYHISMFCRMENLYGANLYRELYLARSSGATSSLRSWAVGLQQRLEGSECLDIAC